LGQTKVILKQES